MIDSEVLWEGYLPRPKEIDITLVIRYLKAAKTPKEIAYLLTHEHQMECSMWAIFKIIDRDSSVQAVYAETYPQRKTRLPKAVAIDKTIVELKVS